MKAIVIGRHASDFGTEQIEVVETVNITFPATGKETKPILLNLANKARNAEAALLFQNTPTPLAAALLLLAKEGLDLPQIGVVVSVPSAMPTEPVVKSFPLFYHTDGREGTNPEVLSEAIRFGNPKAKVEEEVLCVKVTVEPPRPFVFSHIEWLSL